MTTRPQSQEKLWEAAARAEDVGDLLNHIGWTETLRPTLVRQREQFTKFLVEATLGRPVQMATNTGPVTMSREQLAGRIYGIDSILDLVETVLTKGARGVAALRDGGVSLSVSSVVEGNING